MKKLLLYFAFFVLHFSLAYAQEQGSGCDDPLLITKPLTGPLVAKGKAEASLSLHHTNGYYFEKARKVLWVSFIVPEDTLLTFDITPANNKDDIDFLLFKDETEFCEKIKKGEAKALRANIANASNASQGSTGLTNTTVHETEISGKHPAYSKALEVKKGEKYVLVINNYSDSTGAFTLYLHLRWPVVVPASRKPNLVPLSGITLNIIICDSAGKPVKTRLKISPAHAMRSQAGLKDTTGISKYAFNARPGEKLKITCIGRGYLLSESFVNVSGKEVEINDTVKLVQIKEHRKMTLQDVEFEPDLPVFLTRSIEPLSDILEFMQSNPSVKILIKGYVNDPQHRNSNKFDQDLSEARAEAVFKYLTNKGIDAGRMEYVGFGNKDMLYPDPKTIEEQQANRRVEIEVK